MNTSTPRLITPDCQPEFPCWLWAADAKYPHWYRYPAKEFLWRRDYTHWHPDQPTAPTCAPETVNYLEVARLRAERAAPSAQPATGTPRTDAEVTRVFAVTTDDAQRVFLLASFARTLERELAELRLEHGKLNDALGILDYCQIEPLVDDLCTRLTAAERQLAEQTAKLALADELAGATSVLTIVIKSAGVTNLANGVQLGQTSWYHKASDALADAAASLTRYRAATAPTTATKGDKSL
jgi:hypothetical protein